MNHKHITVLRGGPSSEFAVSMKTGTAVCNSLRKQYDLVDDIVITKTGEWLQNGIAKRPEQILAGSDVVFIALHGTYGEDGEVQRLLKRYEVPFTGSSALSSAIAFNKKLTKETLRNFGILMPKDKLFQQTDLENLEEIVDSLRTDFTNDFIIKPVANGSSVGVELVHSFGDLLTSLRQILQTNESVLVEEYIRGREATCATLENFRDENIYVFPVIEIIPPPRSAFFSNDVKYSGETEEICPGNFSYSEKTKISELASFVHQTLGLSQYSRSDFIVKNGEPYFLEVNTLPGLTDQSLFPKAASAVGLTYDELVSHLVETAKK